MASKHLTQSLHRRQPLLIPDIYRCAPQHEVLKTRDVTLLGSTVSRGTATLIPDRQLGESFLLQVLEYVAVSGTSGMMGCLPAGQVTNPKVGFS